MAGPARARPKVGLLDWTMLALAIVSVVLVGYEVWGDPSAEVSQRLILADYIIIAIFAIEFTFRWLRDDRPRTFPLRNWYELLGMIPVSHPALRSFRLLRVVRIVVILSRVGRAADRAFGSGFTRRLLLRFKTVIVDTVGDAITLRALAESEAVMKKGTYTKNMADAMERYGPHITEIVLEKVKADPQLGTVRNLPFFDDITKATTEVTQRILVETLRDPRMDEMVKEMILANLHQIRDAIQKKEDAVRSEELEAGAPTPAARTAAVRAA